MYRVTSYTKLCDSCTLLKVTLRYCTIAYTGQVTFYKVPEDHSHVYVVGLYVYTIISILKKKVYEVNCIISCIYSNTNIRHVGR